MFRARPQDGSAWITGASSGIGRALALTLAAKGFRVVVTARRADLLRELEAEGQGRIRAYPGDLTDACQVAGIVASIERDSPIALAVLNAGVYRLDAERGRFSSDAVLRAIDDNLGVAVRSLDPVLAAMLARKRGQIAVVASLAGYGGVPGSAAYGTAKSALITMTEALRLTYASAGLTFQIVNPGFVATAMTAPNPYPMPFMMSPDAAADRIVRGLERGGFEITFPRRLVWPMKAAFLLPYAAWLPLMARATRRTKSRREPQ